MPFCVGEILHKTMIGVCFKHERKQSNIITAAANPPGYGVYQRRQKN